MPKQIKIEIMPLEEGIVRKIGTGRGAYFQNTESMLTKITDNEVVMEFINDLPKNIDFSISIVLNPAIGDAPTVIQTIDELRDSVVIKETFSPIKKHPEVDEDKLRLSVNQTNAYSAERLKKIDFITLMEEHGINVKRAAEIVGDKPVNMYPLLRPILKGDAKFNFVATRIKMTIIAKYIEAVSGIRTSKKDELDKIKSDIMIEVNKLDLLIKQNNHIHSNTLIPLRDALRSLVE